MNDWWKDPRLDDEGTYDYLVEELPKDYAKWELSRYKWKCDTCGKERYLSFISEQFFYCWDGWDSMSYRDCWVCRTKDTLWRIKHRIKKRIKILKTTMELCRLKSGWNFKKNYEFAKQLER